MGAQNGDELVDSATDTIDSAFSGTDRLSSRISGAVNIAGQLESSPVNIFVSPNESGMKELIRVEIDEGNRVVRTKVRQGVTQ